MFLIFFVRDDVRGTAGNGRKWARAHEALLSKPTWLACGCGETPEKALRDKHRISSFAAPGHATRDCWRRGTDVMVR